MKLCKAAIRLTVIFSTLFLNGISAANAADIGAPRSGAVHLQPYSECFEPDTSCRWISELRRKTGPSTTSARPLAKLQHAIAWKESTEFGTCGVSLSFAKSDLSTINKAVELQHVKVIALVVNEIVVAKFHVLGPLQERIFAVPLDGECPPSALINHLAGSSAAL